MTTHVFSTSTGIQCTLTGTAPANGEDASVQLTIHNPTDSLIERPTLTILLPEETASNRVTALTSHGWHCKTTRNAHTLSPAKGASPLQAGEHDSVTISGLTPLTGHPTTVTEVQIGTEPGEVQRISIPLNLSSVEPIKDFAPESSNYKKGDDITLTASLFDDNSYKYSLTYADNTDNSHTYSDELKDSMSAGNNGRKSLRFTLPKDNTVNAMLTTFSLQAEYREGGQNKTATSATAILLSHGNVAAGNLTINGKANVYGPEKQYQDETLDLLAETDGFIFCALSADQSRDMTIGQATSQAEMNLKVTLDGRPTKYRLKSDAKGFDNTNLTLPVKKGARITGYIPESGRFKWIPLGHMEMDQEA